MVFIDDLPFGNNALRKATAIINHKYLCHNDNFFFVFRYVFYEEQNFKANNCIEEEVSALSSGASIFYHGAGDFCIFF